MNDRPAYMRLDALLHRALVPKGYRPTRDEDIEKMLDAIDSEPIDIEKEKRMLRKISGLEPVFPDRSYVAPVENSELTAYERELVTLHRAQGKPLPPDLAAKVKQMEERAAKKLRSDEESDRG